MGERNKLRFFLLFRASDALCRDLPNKLGKFGFLSCSVFGPLPEQFQLTVEATGKGGSFSILMGALKGFKVARKKVLGGGEGGGGRNGREIILWAALLM